ncbi:MAG: GntR family transcriptional regulator [Clostridiales bacterium]|nr:GntR family transcriptional regulator [Clostridiales bacterium]
MEWLREQLKSDKYKPGSRFCSETDLQQKFGYSRQTIRKAFQVLEEEKLIVRARGKGTFVADTVNAAPAKTNVIGVMLSHVDEYLFPITISTIESVVSKAGYSLHLMLTHKSTAIETRCLRELVDKQVDGIIVEPTQSGYPTVNCGLYSEIKGSGLPMVFINSKYPEIRVPVVCMDDFEAGRLVANELVLMGHKRIAGIFFVDDYQAFRRYAGFRSCLSDSGLFDDRYVLWMTFMELNDLHVQKERLLARLKDCTALVCYNDYAADKIVVYLLKIGVRVPSDLSIISIDNAARAQTCPVPLTSLVIPIEQIAGTAARNVIFMITNPGFNPAKEIKPTTIVTRESVARI